MESQRPHGLQARAWRQSLDLVNLELDRGLTLARFCQVRGNLASAEDLRKAKAAYERALEMFGRQMHLTAWQKRGLERKLKRLKHYIRRIEIAASPVQFGSSGPVVFPTASVLNHHKP
jgi:hypothetical protein